MLLASSSLLLLLLFPLGYSEVTQESESIFVPKINPQCISDNIFPPMYFTLSLKMAISIFDTNVQYRYFHKTLYICYDYCLTPATFYKWHIPGLICSKFNLKRINLELVPAWPSVTECNITSDDYLWKFWLVVAGILTMPTRSAYVLISVIGKSVFDNYFLLCKEKQLHPIPKSS